MTFPRAHECIRAHMHTCLHTCIHTCMHTHTRKHENMHTCMRTCVHLYMHTCVHTSIHAYIHNAHMCACYIIVVVACCRKGAVASATPMAVFVEKQQTGRGKQIDPLHALVKYKYSTSHRITSHHTTSHHGTLHDLNYSTYIPLHYVTPHHITLYITFR